jgi:hypothetical protein
MVESKTCNCTEIQKAVPSWVTNGIGSVIDKNISKPQFKKEKHILQEFVNMLLRNLLKKSFKTFSMEELSVHFEYRNQLSYKSCKKSKGFLPVNFNNSSHDGKANVGIILVESSSKEIVPFKFPILIGELKPNIKFGESPDYLELFNFMLTVQRPYILDDSTSQLVGFLMDFEEAIVFNLQVGNWTDYSPVSSTFEFIL